MRDRYDLDQNGKLNCTELATLCAEWLGVSRRAAAMILRQYDSDGDAELDASELLSLIAGGREATLQTATNSVSSAECDDIAGKYALHGHAADSLSAEVAAWVARVQRPTLDTEPSVSAGAHSVADD